MPRSRRKRKSRTAKRSCAANVISGQVARAFSLAQDVDDASAEASYKDGVLVLTLPKRASSSSRTLAIK